MSCCCCCCFPDRQEDYDEEAGDRGGEIEMVEGRDGKTTAARRPTPAFQVKRKNRSCTDVICLLLFLLCLAALGAVAAAALLLGNPSTLLHPTDSYGNLCGHSNKTKDLPHLVFFDLMHCLRMGPIAIVKGGCPTKQVCVRKCPTGNWAWMDLWLREAAGGRPDIERRKEQMVCDYGDPQNNTEASVQRLVSEGACAPYYLNSTSVAGRCIPSIFSKAVEMASSILSDSGQEIRLADNLTDVKYRDIGNASSYLSVFLSTISVAQNAFHDVVTSRYLILIGVGIGAVVAFAWCALLRCTAAIVVYGTLVAFFLTFAAAAAYSYFLYFTDATLKTFDETLGNKYFTTNFSVYLRIKETWLGLGIAASAVVLIVLVLLVFLRSRLRLAVAIIREASKAVVAIPSSLLFPIWPLLMQVLVVILFAANAALLASSGKKLFAETNSTTKQTQLCSEEAANSTSLKCQFLRYGGNEWTMYLQAFNLFMGFWLSAFVVGFGQLTLAGTFASYYWAWRKPRDLPPLPLLWSLWLTVRYHVGTVAFGSLLIAIVKFIRAALAYAKAKLEGKENLLAKFFFCCLQCFFWCLEKFLKFLSKNAYIVTAVTGKSFCPAARKAFKIVLNNCLRFAVIDKVTDFVLIIGKLMVTGLVTALAFMFFNGKLRFNSYIESMEVELHYFFVPVILIGLSTWIISSIFFSVFEFAVDTMFLCAMVDVSKNDGSPEKPYFMSKNLMKVLDVKNRLREAENQQKNKAENESA